MTDCTVQARVQEVGRLLGRVARPAVALLVVLLVGCVPTAWGKEVTLSGEIRLDAPFVVGQGDVLTILPGTVVLGAGPIEVEGALVVRGADVRVPIRLLRNESHLIEDARVWGVQGTGIEILAGRLTLRNVTIGGHAQRALAVRGDAVVEGVHVDLRENPGDALYVQEASDVRLTNASFTGNGRGATVFSAARVVLEESRFTDNGQHVVVELGPWSRPEAQLLLARNDFGPVAKGPTALASVLLRHDTPLADEQKRVSMQGNRIHDGRVGVRAEGRGLLLESVDDEIVDNEVGLWVQLASVRMRGAVLGNDRNVEGGGDLVLDSVSYIPAVVVTQAPAARVPTAVLVVAGVVAAAGVGALLAPRMRFRAPPVPVPVSVPAAPEPEPSAPALSGIERRILEDVVAHPGTAQRAIADRLGYTRQALHYHVKKLEARGLVEKSVEGRETRCHVPVRVLRALAAAPSSQIESEQKP